MEQRRIFLMLLACVMSIATFAQKQSFSGTVVDDSGEAIIGASVIEKGTSNGAITDFDGKFTVSTEPGRILVISYVGYVQKEVKATRDMRVTLSEDVAKLNEVVVVGYGTQKKVNLSGAVTAIEGEKIAAKPTTDVVQALQGELPGLQVLRNSGQPGSETQGMRIRGNISANADPSALVLIDGVEGDLTLVNPNDVASISVLKDAAACAIYGARAAGGVILVTTKNGTEGKVKVSYNGYVGFNLPGLMPKRSTAWKEQEMINESRIQANGNPEWNPEQSSWVANSNFNYRPNSNGRWDYFTATNWVDIGTRDYTTQQSHNVSISGGNKSLNYLLSGGFFTKNGILKYGPDGNDRYNLRMKINSQLNDHISISMQASYQGKFTEDNPRGAGWILNRMYRIRGRQALYVPDEDPNIDIQPYNGDLQANPIDMMKNGGVRQSNYEAYMGKGEITIKDYFIKGLGLRLSASRQAGYYSQTTKSRSIYWYDRTGETSGSHIRFKEGDPNSMSRKKNNDYHDYLEGMLTYDGKFGKHTVNVLAGSTYERYRKDEVGATIKNLSSNDFFAFGYYDSSIVDNTSVSDLIETWALMSYLGRINYNYDDRYLLEANVRYDGSSRLAPDNRWRAFPSFSGAWRVTEEKWFNVPVVSNIKIRASWGELGNGATLGLYDYIPVINSSTSLGEKNYYQSNMASTSKTWEVISTTNIGVDLGFFNNKLTVTADYFWRKNDNMLANIELPHIVGITVPTANVGTLKSWGWEIEVAYRNKWKDLSYQLSFNLSDNQNEVTKYVGASTINEGYVQILEGYPLNTIWGYKTDGYWSSREEYEQYKADHPGYQSFNDAKVGAGDVKYLAQGNPDHTIGAGGGTPDDPGDLVCLGSPTSRYFYAFNIGLQWRGFDFAIMFQGVGKRKVYIDPGQIAPLSSTSDMPWTIHEDYWTPDNPNAAFPRLYSGNSFNYHAADRWIQDAKYLRLKTLTLGYSVPLKKFGIEKCRVYVSGNDLWEKTDMLSVFDPEVGNSPSANYYPFFRTWTVGLNVTF